MNRIRTRVEYPKAQQANDAGNIPDAVRARDLDAAIIGKVPTRQIMERFGMSNGSVQSRKQKLRRQGFPV